VSMVFQDPMTGLNPVRTIGSLLVEALRRHRRISRADARALAIKALHAVGIPSPELRIKAYPHQLSGGLRQRVMIAMALLHDPAVIIADEPTTALDATIQAQIIDLMRSRMTNAGLILITHDLGVAGQICDRIIVMYAGHIVEEGAALNLLSHPRHPYTAGLLAAAPRFDRDRKPLVPIPGSPPTPADRPAGCPFAVRCPHATDICPSCPPVTTRPRRAGTHSHHDRLPLDRRCRSHGSRLTGEDPRPERAGPPGGVRRRPPAPGRR
jgi:oligopeptide/dipeptide ABC transporter ATP-binding protein